MYVTCVFSFLALFNWIQFPHQLIQVVKQFVQPCFHVFRFQSLLPCVSKPASAHTKVALGGRVAEGHFNRCHSALKVVSSVPNTPNIESHQMLYPVPIGSIYIYMVHLPTCWSISHGVHVGFKYTSIHKSFSKSLCFPPSVRNTNLNQATPDFRKMRSFSSWTVPRKAWRNTARGCFT